MTDPPACLPAPADTGRPREDAPELEGGRCPNCGCSQENMAVLKRQHEAKHKAALRASVSQGPQEPGEQHARALLFPLLGLNPEVDTLGAAMKRINELKQGPQDAPTEADEHRSRLRVSPEPTNQPDDPRGRFMLNSYGRQCFDLGFQAAKAEAEGHGSRLPAAPPAQESHEFEPCSYPAQAWCGVCGEGYWRHERYKEAPPVPEQET